MPVLVATDIAARGLDIDQLPQVVNFELPNVPEDYVHRIGRTGRAGITGAAVSLVDHEELKFLKDIERLIKRDIPKVVAEAFVPPTRVDPEAPRPPRPQQRRGASQGQRQGRSQNGGQAERPRHGQPNGRPNNGRPAYGHQTASSQPANRPTNRPPENKPVANQHMSEAARHQAMPQAALFSPKPIHRGGNRGR